MSGGIEIRDRDVAVVGMAGRFPGAPDLAAFWRLLAEGREAVSVLSDEELRAAGIPDELIAHPGYVKAASLLAGVEEFDAGFFGYTAREAEIMDPQQRLFLEHAWAALEDAGWVPERYPGLIGVYAGVAWNTYLLSNLREHPELFAGGGAFQVFITNDKDFMPTRASYKLGLKGPSLIVQTSCSTSLVAIHLAALSLLNYECDMALAGGVTVKVPQTAGYLYEDGGLASPDGHCRPFDADAAGTIFGSGAGIVVLKRLADAIEDGDTIRAVLRGSAINNDGEVKVSYTAPSVEGQAEVVAAAQAVAEVDPATIGYVECHGTGTSLGDPVEVTALTKVFRESTGARGFCALGSVKSNVGHLDAAAGVAGFLKTVLALEHRQIPPSVNFRRPNPRLDLDTSPFRVAAALADWPAGETPRRAGVSSFGVGGTNAHAVLEEAPSPPPPAPSRPWQLLLLSARSPQALDAATANLGAALAHGVPAGGSLADVAWTLSAGRRVFPHRRVLVASGREDAAAALAERPAERLPTVHDAGEPRRRPVAFLFPGQGAQHPGMARRLYDCEPTFREHLDQAAELLRGELAGEEADLRRLLFPAADADPVAAAARLEATAVAQPALFAVEVALARLWMEWGVVPAAMLGHSLGELAAACVAGVFSFADGLRLVAARGRLMQAAPAGAMLALPLPAAEIERRLADHPGVELAAVNQPERATVAGPEEAVAAFAAALAADGVEARRLHTSHAFHSAAMDGAVAPFRAAAAGVALSPPSIPFVSNLTGTWITDAEATDPGYWARHLRGRVRFDDGLAALLAEEDRVLLEVGPGTTLTTLARRHPARAGQPVVHTLPAPRDAEADGPHGDAQAAALGALGRLWMAGVEIDWQGYWGGETRRRLPLPTYPFERRRYWIDAAPAAGRRAGRPAAVAAGKQPDVGAWFHRATWSEEPLPPTEVEAELPRRWWLLAPADGAGPDLSGALTAALEERGLPAVAVEPDPSAKGLTPRGAGRWALRPAEAADWKALVAEVGVPDAVVHLWSATPTTPEPVGGRGSDLGFPALAALLAALPEDAPLDLTVAARGLFAVTGGEPLRPAVAPLLGVVRVLPEERPGARARAVDLGAPGGRPDAPRRLAERLLAEIAAAMGGADGERPGEGEAEIALRGGQRWVRRYRPAPLPPAGEAALRDGGVYVVTGGTSGDGLGLARYLVRQHRARLLLVEDAPAAGDDEAVAAERRRRVAEVAAAGGEAELLEIDLADTAAWRAAVDRAADRYGALHGIVHAAVAGGAGELDAFQALARSGRPVLERHLRPRLAALAALAAALDEPGIGAGLDFVVVLSSLAGALGGVANGAYAAACLAADAFVEERNRTAAGAPWLVLDWDAWRHEANGDAPLRGDLARLAMTPREGEEAFRRAVAAARAGRAAGRLLVSTEALDARLAERLQRIAVHAGAGAADTAGERHPRPELDVPYAAPESDLERRIAAVWGELLGFERIGLDDNFFELGGDSFVAVRVASRLQDALGAELPVAQLYEALTVRSLARLVERTAAGAEERAEHLEERRAASDRRKERLARRRERIGATP